jgi:hypothetical protein
MEDNIMENNEYPGLVEIPNFRVHSPLITHYSSFTKSLKQNK